MSKREQRTFSATEIRASAPAEGKQPGVDGYAAVFNSAFDIKFPGYLFREIIKPGAFSRAIREKQDVRCLYNHNDDVVLGRTKSGTLALAEDKRGLKFRCDLPDTQAARDVRTSIDRGDIDGCSIGFIVRKQSRSEEKLDDGTLQLTRTIEDVDLLDVSPVTFPAYEQTSCEARALFPDGIPAEVEQFKQSRAKNECQCDCPECEAGNCDECTDANCDDENCRCHDRAATKHHLELRARAAAATL